MALKTAEAAGCHPGWTLGGVRRDLDGKSAGRRLGLGWCGGHLPSRFLGYLSQGIAARQAPVSLANPGWYPTVGPGWDRMRMVLRNPCRMSGPAIARP